MTLRLLLDEDVSPRVAEGLRRRGVDAVSVHEVDRANRRIADADQLAFAAEAGRALVTYNRADFQALDALWRLEGRVGEERRVGQPRQRDGHVSPPRSPRRRGRRSRRPATPGGPVPVAARRAGATAARAPRRRARPAVLRSAPTPRALEQQAEALQRGGRPALRERVGDQLRAVDTRQRRLLADNASRAAKTPF